jgi:large subunit ribosomal protein L6
MSRIGKSPISIPDKVNVQISGDNITAKGPKGELNFTKPEIISLEQDGNTIHVKRSSDDKRSKSLHGLTRSMIFNMVTGVSQGFKKVLQIEGVGFRAEMKGNRLMLNLGYSHPIIVLPPNGVSFATPNATTIEIDGHDKQLVGEVAYKIRKLRKPEPYKGKGIRYQGEYIRRKAGKSASKK